LLARGEFDLLTRRGIANADVDACERERVLGVLGDAVFGEGLPIRDDARRHLIHRLRRRAVSTVALDSRCAAALELFDANGIEVRVLKGAAVARLDYDRTELRHYGDIDLLVRGQDMTAAVTLLEQRGFHRHFAEPFPGHDETFGKGVAVEGSGAIAIDLHRTLALGYYGTHLRVAELWRDAEPVELAGIQTYALAPVERFVHAALHGALSPSVSLVDSLDLVTIMHHTAPDAGAVIECVERWGCAAPVVRSVLGADDEFPGRLPSVLVGWADGHRRRAVEWIADHAYTGLISGSRLRTATAVAGVRDHRSWMGLARGLTLGGRGRPT
jgi:hypothetical protein